MSTETRSNILGKAILQEACSLAQGLCRFAGLAAVVAVAGAVVELTHPTCETRKFVAPVDFFGVMGKCQRPTISDNQPGSVRFTAPAWQ